MKRFMPAFLRQAEHCTEELFKRQCLTADHPDFGGIQVNEWYIEPKMTIYRLATAIAVYCNRDSRYHADPALLARMHLALDYLHRMQRQDGTFDYPNCNFMSAPDTAFIVQEIIPSHRLLVRYSEVPEADILKAKLEAILREAGRGMAEGGFHTPNHRWAIASVLLAVNSIVPDEKFKARADEYLREGIDSNEDGEYAERSAAIYNVVNNDAMIRLFEETGKVQYLDCARKNLTMMLHYFEPDLSVFTANSTRQDRGRKMYPCDYIYQYLYLADYYKDAALEGAAHQMLEVYFQESPHGVPDVLDMLMVNDRLTRMTLQAHGFPAVYDRHFQGSGSVRLRNGNFTASILKDNSQFFSLQVGNLPVYFKIGASWFEHRHFKAQTLERSGDGYLMTFRARGWYYLPFGESQGTTDWWQMKNDERNKIYKEDLVIRVEISPLDTGISVRIVSDGCDRVPLRLEIGLPADCLMDSPHFWQEGKPGACMLVREGDVTVTSEGDRIRIGPAFGTHQFIHGKEGSEPRSEFNQTLYFTDFTPFDHTVRIEHVD